MQRRKWSLRNLNRFILQKKNSLIWVHFKTIVRFAKMFSTIGNTLKLDSVNLKTANFISVMIDGATNCFIAEN